MTVDYEAIRAHHKRWYGEGIDQFGGFLEHLYADRTHFVFELLQNAQDAAASRIRFDLRPDRLEVRHDGRRFTDADVRGICGIVSSTKSADDPEQIGRFGVGFKSVYAYTRRPTIHCGPDHFAIEHYVHPHAVDPIYPGAGWSTLQVFPFDRDDVSPQEALAEIQPRLATLSARTILFLSSLRELAWATADGAQGTISREEHKDRNARRVRLIHDGAGDSEQWLIFARGVQLVLDRPPNRVEVAFRVTRDEGGSEQITGADNTELVAFFPTTRETHLGFLVQGPFVTTPARDNVLEGSPTNKRLAEELAQLTVHAMTAVRDRGLLDVGFLKCLPIDVKAFPEGALLRPIYDDVRQALKEEPLLPTDNGRHVPATEARLARGSGLRELFSPAQLGALLGIDQEIDWAAAEISLDRTPTLHRYLVGYQPRHSFGGEREVPALVPAMELTPEAVARRLQPAFLTHQTRDWMIRLYGWLLGQAALIRDLRERRIVRRADGEHVAAFDGDRPQIWLPPSGDTSYAIVDRAMAADEQALEFFRRLGLTTPDLVDEVITYVLPSYQGDRQDDSNYESDLGRIASALSAATGSKHQRLCKMLKETPFLRGRNAATGEHAWLTAAELYEPTDELEIFLDGSRDAWLLCNECLAYAKSWRELGVADDVRITRTHPDRLGYVPVTSSWGSHSRGRDGFDPEFEIDGLDHAVAHPTPESSLVLWNLLARENVPLQGTVETSTRQDYSANATSDHAVSPAGKLLTSHPWLIHNDGSWRTPHEMSLDELDPAFRRDEGLAIRLQMRPTVRRETAAYLDIDPDDLEFMRQNPDVWKDSVREARRTTLHAQSDGLNRRVEANGDGQSLKETEPVDVDEAIRAAFNRPGDVDLDDSFTDGRAYNPSRRRARGTEALREAQTSEPDSDTRWRVVPRKAWETRDPTVREYLAQTYGGSCQICSSTFPRRDGKPFFEAKYLISPTAARWVDTPGNSLCLCPTCLAKMLHGSVDGPDVLEQLSGLAEQAADVPDGASIEFALCGEKVRMRFAQRHLIDLGVLLNGDQPLADETGGDAIGEF